MALVVLDMPKLIPHCSTMPSLAGELKWEQQLVDSATKHGVTPMLLFNAKGGRLGVSLDQAVGSIR